MIQVDHLRDMGDGQYMLVDPNYVYERDEEYDAVSIYTDNNEVGFLITEGEFEEGISITPIDCSSRNDVEATPYAYRIVREKKGA